jgi:hypothetical protein
MRQVLTTIGIMSMVIFFITSCSVKELEKYNEDFKGSWRSTVYFSPQAGDSIRNYLKVDGSNSAFGLLCDESTEFEACLYFQQGKAKYNKVNKGLQIGNSVQNIYQIDQEPFVNSDGTWEMLIDSISYFKY